MATLRQTKMKIALIAVLLVGAVSTTNAQTGFVGVGTGSPKAKLDITSDTSGILIPRYATLALVNSDVLPKMNATDHNGMLVYVAEAANRGFWYYNGTVFVALAGANGIFKKSTVDANNIIYDSTSYYGKNFIVNADSVNYDGSGTDAKMMFIPIKNAFRVGAVFNKSWDIDSIGYSSIAIGTGSKAKGSNSIAMGPSSNASTFNAIAIGLACNATDFAATAIGNSTEASGYSSLATGFNTVASGYGTTALGVGSRARGTYANAFGFWGIASGQNASTIGNFTISKSYSELAVGLYNDTLVDVNATSFANDTNRVFTVGNGTSVSTRKTAFVIQQNGNVGVGDRKPTSTLSVNGGVAMPFINVTGNTTLNNTHYAIRFSGAIASTITLPAASSAVGRIYKIINGGSVALSSSSFIDYSGSGVTSIASGTAITLQSDGINWHQTP